MNKVLHIQQTIAAPASTVFNALTEDKALKTWFAEHASVSLDDGRYDFWGRLTPETPGREGGRHEIEIHEPGRRLQYRWRLRDGDTTVDLRLTERDGETVVGMWHHDIPSVPGSFSMNDIWSLWLENLRRYVDGRPTVRCDFSSIAPGDFTHAVEIDGSVAEVWNTLVEPEAKTRWIAHSDTASPAVGRDWIDWGEGAGALKILDLVPNERLVLGWEIDGEPTVVTWSIEGAAGKARLTLTHSGFGPDRRTDGEWAGWLAYLVRVQSLVEYGIDWLPPLTDMARDASLYYAATIWSRQEELLEAESREWAPAGK